MILAFRLAKNSLKKHRLRTFLAMIGVMVGVFLISLVILTISGIKKSLEQQISATNSEIFLIKNRVDNQGNLSILDQLKISPISNLTLRDANIISQEKSVNLSAPEIFLSGEISHKNNKKTSVSIVATNQNFAKIFDLKMKSGTWFDTNEMDKNWVILGQKLASEIIKNQDAAGQIIKIKNQDFLVIGVINSTTQPISLAGTNIDQTAFISLNQGIKLDQNIDSVGQIIARGKNQNEKINIENLTEKLRENHNGAEDFVIINSKQASQNISNQIKTFSQAAVIFAVISLIVGGIGIMNVMLVGITERRREIGIRKAVGAKNRQVLLQFLFEAILISLSGGFLGILFAYLVGFFLAISFALPIVFNLEIIIFGLILPTIIGIFFGFFPSLKAAKSDPIVALRNL